MALVEACSAQAARHDPRAYAALCGALGKTVIEVPDTPGFVVKRLRFTYLFDAVELHDGQRDGARAGRYLHDAGAGLPMGPLALMMWDRRRKAIAGRSDSRSPGVGRSSPRLGASLLAVSTYIPNVNLI